MTNRAVQTTANEVPRQTARPDGKQVSNRPTSSTHIPAGQPTENRAVRRNDEPSIDGTQSSRPNRPGAGSPGLDGSTSEAALQAKVIDTAHMLGWRVAAFRPAQTEHGWRTAVTADGIGYPDLTLVHPAGHVLWAELKSQGGQLGEHQAVWRDCLIAAGCDWRLWRPSNWPEIVATLSLGGATT